MELLARASFSIVWNGSLKKGGKKTRSKRKKMQALSRNNPQGISGKNQRISQPGVELYWSGTSK